MEEITYSLGGIHYPYPQNVEIVQLCMTSWLLGLPAWL